MAVAAAVAMTPLAEEARRWADADPDPVTRAEVELMIAAGDRDGLTAAFGTTLTFGTAGIRGKVGPGPAQMNRAVVIRTTAGLAAHLGDTAGRPVVVAFDARPTSERFARDAAGVLVAAGIPVVFFPTPTPTPLAAYTAKTLGAVSAVVVTASHNPPQDNGYKVYGSNAAQIIPPVDAEIAARIDTSPPASGIPRVDDPETSDLFSVATDEFFLLYQEEVARARPHPVRSSLRIVYTPIHGCGGEPVTRLIGDAGHTGLIPVVAQFAPDGTFPTVGFPNPEEPGALDLALETARGGGADLIIANDPDADRLAAALPWVGEWRILTGNELGVLLADHVLSAPHIAERPIVISSIVSSPMLRDLAAVRGARHESTLTGFKWIVNAGLALEAAGEGRFVYGYEEALGYTIGSVVRDKDGMSAALIFCDLVEGLRRRDATVWDRLAELWSEVGVWASAQESVTHDSMADAVDRLSTVPPSHVGGHEVTRVVDYRTDADSRPFWLGSQELIELAFGQSGRVLVRPSGTEPKLKIYVDLRKESSGDPLAEQQWLGERAASVASELAEMIR